MTEPVELVIRTKDQSTGTINTIRRSLSDLEGEAKGIASRGLGGLTTVLGAGIKAAVATGTAAIVGLGTAIYKATGDAADMEQQVANIAATMGLTAEETSRVNDLITDLGLDPKLKVSAVEAANAIEMLGKNGLELDQIMGGAARSSVLLANSTGADLAQAADIATDVMAQFGIEADDMARAVNGITGVTKSSKFDINDYSLAIAQAGGVAGSVGVDFEDFNAVIAAISPNFASGSDAGTSFKTFLQRLNPDTDKAKDAMAELGLYTADTGSAFFDASGQMKGMSEIAGLLQGAFGNLSEAQRIQYASTIFGTDAMRAAFGIAEAGAPTIDALKASIGNVDAEEAAATRMNTFRGALEIASGIVETLSIQIGQKFLPVLRPLIEQFSRLADQHGPQLVAMFGRLAEALAGGIQWVVEWVRMGMPMIVWFNMLPEPIQRVVTTIGRFAQTVWAAIQPVVQAIIEFVSWQDVLTALGALVAAIVIPALGSIVAAVAPVVAVVVGAVAVVATLRNAWENDWLGIKTVTLQVWEIVQEALSKGLALVRDLMQNRDGSQIMRWLRETFPQAVQALQDVWRRVTDAIKSILPEIGLSTESMGEWVGRVLGTLARWWEEHGDTVRSLVDGVLARAIESIGDMVEAMAKIIGGILKAVQGDWSGAWESMREAGQIIWNRISDNVAAVLGGMRKLYDMWLAQYVQAGLDKWHELRAGIAERIDAIKENVGDRWTWIRETVIGAVRAMVENVVERVTAWRDWWRERLQQIWEFVKTYLNPIEWARAGWDVIQGLWDGFRERWNRFTSWTSETWRGWVDRFRDFFRIRSPSGLFYEFGTNITDGLRLGIADRAGSVYDELDTIGRGLSGRMSNIVKNIGDALAGSVTKPITDTLVGGITITDPTKVKENEEKIKEALADYRMGLNDFLKDTFGGFMAALDDAAAIDAARFQASLRGGPEYVSVANPLRAMTAELRQILARLGGTTAYDISAGNVSVADIIGKITQNTPLAQLQELLQTAVDLRGYAINNQFGNYNSATPTDERLTGQTNNYDIDINFTGSESAGSDLLGAVDLMNALLPA